MEKGWKTPRRITEKRMKGQRMKEEQAKQEISDDKSEKKKFGEQEREVKKKSCYRMKCKNNCNKEG